MKRLVTLIVTVFALALGGLAFAAPAEAVVGGVEVSPGSYPYYVRVLADGYSCGGSVIATGWILTAAHCVDNGVTPSQVTVKILDYDPYPARQIIVHPLWNGDFSKGHDMAVIRVDAFATSGITPIRVGAQFQQYLYSAGTPVTIVGHGATYGGGPATSELRAAQTVVRSTADMQGIYNYPFITDWPFGYAIGAGTTSVTACNGDSGGPLVAKLGGVPVEIGVASFTQTWPSNCGQPAAFTEMNDEQLAWLAVTVPGVTAAWGNCPLAGGSAGTAIAQYTTEDIPWDGRDGQFYWEIGCYGKPVTGIGGPSTGSGSGPTSGPTAPPTTICDKMPWKCTPGPS